MTSIEEQYFWWIIDERCSASPFTQVIKYEPEGLISIINTGFIY